MYYYLSGPIGLSILVGYDWTNPFKLHKPIEMLLNNIYDYFANFPINWISFSLFYKNSQVAKN